MTREFDPRKSYLTLKANEKMVAFVGYSIHLEETDETKHGVVKISSDHRPYGGGYLTLTFIVDIGDRKDLKNQLNRLFNNLTDESIRASLGKEFERMVKVSLDSLEKVKGWYVEEINVHFRSIGDREKVIIEEKIIPALEGCLPFTFDPVEWWPESRPDESPEKKDIEEDISLTTLFKKWFGAG
ncbi:MAG: hypothetical protein PVF14_08720 [Desulfobacterales bacterium]